MRRAPPSPKRPERTFFEPLLAQSCSIAVTDGRHVVDPPNAGPPAVHSRQPSTAVRQEAFVVSARAAWSRGASASRKDVRARARAHLPDFIFEAASYVAAEVEGRRGILKCLVAGNALDGWFIGSVEVAVRWLFLSLLSVPCSPPHRLVPRPHFVFCISFRTRPRISYRIAHHTSIHCAGHAG